MLNPLIVNGPYTRDDTVLTSDSCNGHSENYEKVKYFLVLYQKNEGERESTYLFGCYK